MLIGMAVLVSIYLWSSRTSSTVDIVTVRPAAQSANSSIQVVPYQQKLEPDAPRCSPKPSTGGFCLVIVANPTATPGSMTFT